MAGMRLERRVEGFHPKKNEEGDEGQVPFGNVGGQRRNFLLFSFLEFMM